MNSRVYSIHEKSKFIRPFDRMALESFHTVYNSNGGRWQRVINIVTDTAIYHGNFHPREIIIRQYFETSGPTWNITASSIRMINDDAPRYPLPLFITTFRLQRDVFKRIREPKVQLTKGSYPCYPLAAFTFVSTLLLFRFSFSIIQKLS